MSRTRKNRRAAVGLGGVALGLVLVSVAVVNLRGDDGATRSLPAAPSVTDPAPDDTDPAPPEAAAPEAETPTSIADLDPSQGRVTFPGAGDAGGIPGEGSTTGLPRHSLTIRLTSRAPISGAGYIIPTSVDDYYGLDRDVGTSWSMTTTVYGDPAYAQVFSQAGARGVPVTCTITVDGKVTERRTTDGPYGNLYCVG